MKENHRPKNEQKQKPHNTQNTTYKNKKWFYTKSTNLICTSSKKWSRNVIEKKWYKKVIAKNWLEKNDWKGVSKKVKNVVFDNGSNEVI